MAPISFVAAIGQRVRLDKHYTLSVNEGWTPGPKTATLLLFHIPDIYS